jgi:hypothetical protein
MVMKQKPPKASRIHEEDSNGEVVDTQEGSYDVIWGRLQKTTHTLQFTYTSTMVTIIKAPSMITFERWR